MIKNVDDMQKIGNTNLDATMNAFGAIIKSTQAIAIEIADYSRRAFENATKTMENLVRAKSLDKAVEVQSEYAKSAYEGWVTLATKLGQIYADQANETFKPYESLSRK
jgi:hypothetical protein